MGAAVSGEGERGERKEREEKRERKVSPSSLLPLPVSTEERRRLRPLYRSAATSGGVAAACAIVLLPVVIRIR